MSTKLGSLSIVRVQLGLRKLSVIQSSGMSAVQGLLKYWSEWKNSWDFQNCPLYCGCPLLRDMSVKRGSTVVCKHNSNDSLHARLWESNES